MLKHFLPAAVALGFLIVMGQKEDAHFEAHSHGDHAHSAVESLVSVADGTSVKLALKQGAQSWLLERKSSAWGIGDTKLDDAEQRAVTAYLSMLSNSKPVRTFSYEELKTNEPVVYGLQSPSLETIITVSDGTPSIGERHDSHESKFSQTLISFGHASPDGSLRYAQRGSEDTLYVMSGFIYTQAEEVIRLLKKRTGGD